MWNSPTYPISMNDDVSSSCSNTLFDISSSTLFIFSRVFFVSSIFFCSDTLSLKICWLSLSSSSSRLTRFFSYRVESREEEVESSPFLLIWGLAWLPIMACSFLFLFSLNSMNSPNNLVVFFRAWYKQMDMFLKCSRSLNKRVCTCHS